ncbi:hypothetical protein AALO_G00215590 [Alosa alosa]|uniref:C-C motif chemokine n=1 Tax=Alosa alosa TaxID=278164 RepID=A0AAV6G3R7_9TELE|nr:eotaxin-like [Alosa alosa]XP_048122751.1 eotaxin-like [Alosa alosa]KAG5268712.1 hypothetical protein AALO_G00215590 [Alosa alosa]
MNIFTFSVCCLISICLILPAVSSPATNCCLALSSVRLKPSNVKTYHIQQQGGICPINAVVLVTKKSKRICADPDSQWVKDAMRIVNEKKEAAKSGANTESSNTPQPGGNGPPKRRRKGKGRGRGKGKKHGGRRARKQQAQ